MSAPEGPTVTVVSVGLTKKPLQPTAKADSKRAANAAKIRIFRLLLNMIEGPSGHAFSVTIREWRKKNCSREAGVHRPLCLVAEA
jgi:hypothetical protein